MLLGDTFFYCDACVKNLGPDKRQAQVRRKKWFYLKLYSTLINTGDQGHTQYVKKLHSHTALCETLRSEAGDQGHVRLR